MNIMVGRLGLVLIVTMLLSSSALAQMRVGTVDLGKLFDNYWKTKQAQGVLKEREADMVKEIKNLIEDGRKAKEAYDKIMSEVNDPVVTSEERERRKKEAEDKLKYMKNQEETIAQYERQARATLGEQTRRMRENILTEIRTIIDAKAKSGGFTLIIDTAAESAARTPVFLYVTKDNDLTQDVLKELNAAAPAETSVPSPDK